MASVIDGDKVEASDAIELSQTAQARLSVSVPRGLGRKIKLLAHDRDMTVSELLLHLIKSAIR